MTSALGTGSSALAVVTHDGVGDDALVAAWDALVARDPDATLFQRARWLRRWDEVLAGQRTMRTRTFHRGGASDGADGELVGVLVETRELLRLPSGPGELIRLAGGDEVTDYLGPVAAPEDRAAVADAYVAALAADRGWDEVVLGGLAADTGWHERFTETAAQHGLGVVEADVEAVCPVVDLREGLGAHLGRMSSRMRQDLDRKARKLARDAGDYVVHQHEPEDVAVGIDDFLRNVRGGNDGKGLFFRRPEMDEWFRALAEEFAADGSLRVHRLDVGSLTAAMTVSLVDPASGMWGLYNSWFDPTLAALAPGMVLIWDLIRMAAADGFTSFDLLRGDEPYKYRFGAVDRPLHTLTLVRR